MSFLVSVGIIVGVFIVCDSLRLRLRASKTLPTLLKITLGDLLVTTEQFVGTLEQGVTLDAYGRPGFALGLFLICTYQILRFRENLPTPIIHFYSLFVSKTQTFGETVLRILSLICYGFFVQRVLMRAFWALNLSEFHGKRLEFLHSCFFPDGWSPGLALSMEFLGSLLLAIGPQLINEAKALEERPMARTALKSVLAVSLVLVGFDISGGMYNPVLATVLLGSCAGHSYEEHVAVYWVGATAGSLVGSLVYPFLKSRLPFEKIHKKEV